MSYKIQKKNFKANIREVNVGDIKINSANSLPFMRSEQGNCNPLFAIEVLINIPKNYSSALEEYWGDIISDMPKWVDKVLKLNDIMIPPQSSATMSSNAALGKNDSSNTKKTQSQIDSKETGRPEKPDDQKSEKTI